ncbi:hypothetical protein B296_00047550, partial [Ensete ventricosum]
MMIAYSCFQVVASLLYADSGTPVEKTRDDAEAPLLTSCDGLEYPSTDRPVMLLRGRATFKLKISQLSSKCDNRLFRVCFHPLHGQRYPFLEAYSCPIRCISRNRSNRTMGFGKRSLSTTVLLDEIHLLKASDGLQAIRDVYGNGQLKASNQSDLKCSPQSKHFKVEDNRSTTELVANGSSEQDLEILHGIAGCGDDLGREEFDRMWHWLDRDSRLLQDLLLEEPELSQLG